MKKLIFMFFLLLLSISIGQTQEHPVLADNSSVQPKRVSKFQGRWQERKGHGLYLDYGCDYGYIKDKAKVIDIKWPLPLRFDLTYQYDIPWRAKRVNLFVETGFGYERMMFQRLGTAGSHETNDYIASKSQWVEQRLSWRFGGGFKIHCTDWLYLSFEGGFQVGYDHEKHEETNQNNGNVLYKRINELTLLGGQSAMQVVGQVKRVSIHLGYRANHWLYAYRHKVDTQMVTRNLTAWFLTIGVGYHF